MQSVKLNLIPGAVLPVVNVSQYDVERTFQLAVYDGAASYDLTGKTVTIRGTKPDNHGFDYGTSDGVVSVSGNTVTISTTQQMTAVGGHVMAEIRIASGTTVIGTLNFIIDVEPSALSDDTIISDTEIPVIERSAWEQVEQAEKWATGAHDGTPVGPSEPQFENSAKWWAQHASTLGGLTDVDIESPTNDQVLKYDSATQTWKNGTGGGGASALDVTAQQQLGAWNLAQNNGTTQTLNGATFTKNADDTVTVDIAGSAVTATTKYILSSTTDVYVPLPDRLKPGETYYLSGCTGGNYSGTDGGSDTFFLWCNFRDANNLYLGNVICSKAEKAFTIPANATQYEMGINIYAAAGKLTGKVFSPMIALQPNMPYVPYVMTNKELTDKTDQLSSAFLDQGILDNTSDLDNVLTQGLYHITSKPAHSPEQWSPMMVYKRSNSDVRQVIYGSNNSIFVRVRGGSPAYWDSWYKFEGTIVS